MKEILRCREMASLCRQRSAFYHDEKWAWLAKATMWDDLADQYIEQQHKIEEDIRIVPEDQPRERGSDLQAGTIDVATKE
jgi:hypothetical protein